MEIFNNQQRSGYEEVKSYGPSWWTEYREMDAVYRFAGWTLDLMAYWLEKIISNQFPLLADENMISDLEKVFGIEPEEEDSLEERRKMVAAYCFGSWKLSASEIQSIIKIYSGFESNVYWENDVLMIMIYADEEDVTSLNSKIYQILERRMPAHISYSIGFPLVFNGSAEFDGTFFFNA